MRRLFTAWAVYPGPVLRLVLGREGGPMGAWLNRIGKSFVQGFVASAGIAQLVDAVSRQDLPALALLGLAGLGGAVMAAITTIRVLLMKPPDTPGIWGVMERALWTFISGAVTAVPVEILAAGITNLDLRAVRSAVLAGLAGGMAGLLSLAWNLTSQAPAMLFGSQIVSGTSVYFPPSNVVHPRIPRSEPPY